MRLTGKWETIAMNRTIMKKRRRKKIIIEKILNIPRRTTTSNHKRERDKRTVFTNRQTKKRVTKNHKRKVERSKERYRNRIIVWCRDNKRSRRDYMYVLKDAEGLLTNLHLKSMWKFVKKYSRIKEPFLNQLRWETLRVLVNRLFLLTRKGDRKS